MHLQDDECLQCFLQMCEALCYSQVLTVQILDWREDFKNAWGRETWFWSECTACRTWTTLGPRMPTDSVDVDRVGVLLSGPCCQPKAGCLLHMKALLAHLATASPT